MNTVNKSIIKNKMSEIHEVVIAAITWFDREKQNKTYRYSEVLRALNKCIFSIYIGIQNVTLNPPEGATNAHKGEFYILSAEELFNNHLNDIEVEMDKIYISLETDRKNTIIASKWLRSFEFLQWKTKDVEEQPFILF